MTTLSRVLRPIAGAAGLALAIGLGALPLGSPAYADTRTTPDAVGDPVRTTYDDTTEGDGVETEPAPQAARVDLVSTRYDYRRQFLVVRGTARAAGRGVQFSARVRAQGQDYLFAGAPGGRVQGFRVSGREGERVRCPGARSAVDPDAGTYGLRIPAGCFGAPGTVRLGFGVSQVTSTRQSFSSTSDDGNRTGGTGEDFGDSRRLGSALARGADARTTPDAVGDPVRTTYTFDASEPEGETAPRARKVDLVSTRFDYRNQVLVVRGTAQAAGRGVQAFLRVRAAGRESFFFRAPGGRITGFGDGRGAAQCRGGSSEVDVERGVYELRVPSRCFGSPESVRLGFGLASDRSTRRTSSSTVDDANRIGGTQDVFDLKLGSALARG